MRKYHQWFKDQLTNLIDDIDDEHYTDKGLVRQMKQIINRFEKQVKSDKAFIKWMRKK